MKVVFWGTPSYALESLNAIHNSEHKIIGVVSQPDKRRNRGKSLSFSPIKQRSIELDIPVFTPNNLKEESKIKDDILNLEADIYIVVAFGQILPLEILQRPVYGSWNSHASLLPRWRGAAPIQRSLMAGDIKTGIGIMFMEEGLDTGAILMQEQILIDQYDNYEVLSNKLSKLSAKLLLQTLSKLSTLGRNNLSQLHLHSQDLLDEEISYAKMISKKEYLINWNNTEVEINRRVRGLYPYAYTYWKGKRLKVIECLTIDQIKYELLANNDINLTDIKNKIPGKVIGILSNYGILILTSDNPILITKAQLEGKKINSGNSLIQQLDASIGDSFS